MIFIMKNKTVLTRAKTLSALKKAFAVVLALAVWQIAAIAVNQPILFASPVSVIKRLCSLVTENDFWQTVMFSFTRIAGGFLIALIVGIILGVTAGRFKTVETLLWPYMITIKSVPVASFIVLSLIWLTSGKLSVFISFLMVLPVVYTNILQGIRSTDKKLIQMADVFKINTKRRFLYIWLPQIKPFLLSACSVTLGLAWKAGIAAEVIGISSGSIGEKLYYSKVYIDTADLFSWTVVIVVLSITFEKIFLWILERAFARLERQ